jgi:diketogulonate reductase-like aldo/keto reductase
MVFFCHGILSVCSAVSVTKSSNKERLKGMLAAGDLKLSHHEIQAIERAGRQSAMMEKRRAQVLSVGKWVSLVGLAGFAGWRMVA